MKNKNIILLLIALVLLIVGAILVFKSLETKKVTPYSMNKLSYTNAFVIPPLTTIEEFNKLLEGRPTAGAVDLAALSSSITQEAVKAFTTPSEHPLPLLAHWNTGDIGTEGMTPSYVISLIEQGNHILPSWRLQPYWKQQLSETYYMDSILRAKELNLPLTFVIDPIEKTLSEDSYYLSLSTDKNPNVIDLDSNIVQKLSPFGPDDLWSEVGKNFANAALLKQIQEWYPNPPLVMFVDNQNADKLSWNELATSQRFIDRYGNTTDDNFKRTVIGASMIEKYRLLHDTLIANLVSPTWKTNTKFVSYDPITTDIGRSTDWINEATFTNYEFSYYPLTTNGMSENYFVDGSTESINNALFNLNNIPFITEEAYKSNDAFSLQLSLSDDNSFDTLDKYRGFSQLALWLTRPNIVREYVNALNDKTVIMPRYQAVIDSAEMVHNDSTLQKFWKNGELVANTNTKIVQSINVLSYYNSSNKWFLLDVDVNPQANWSPSVNIPVSAIALKIGVEPNREWLLFAQSPSGDLNNITVTIPEYGNVDVSSSAKGNFYVIGESAVEEVVAVGVTEATPNNPPQVQNVTIVGKPQVGETLTLNYDFSDIDGDLESGSIIAWSMPGDEVQRGISKTYKIPAELAGLTLTAWIHPSDGKVVNAQGIQASNGFIAIEAAPGTTVPPTTTVPIFGARPVAATDISRATKFASPTGSGNGTIDNPYSIVNAFNSLVAGDVLFLRGGNYNIPTTSLRIQNKKGTATNPIIIESYPGEVAIFDGKNRTPADVIARTHTTDSNGGFWLDKDTAYVYIRKIKVTGMRGIGVRVGGKYCIVEGCEIHHNFRAGMDVNDDIKFYVTPYVNGWNKVRDNHLHHNSDAGITGISGYNDGDNSDGISVHSGQYNEVSHNTINDNGDDGIDTWKSNDTLITYNAVHNNGKGGNGNGGGIKMGGNLNSADGNGLRAKAYHNLSYSNRSNGFNGNAGRDIEIKFNTTYNNPTAILNVASGTVVANNISFQDVNIGPNSTAAGRVNNSWQIGGTVTVASTDPLSPDFLKPTSTTHLNIGAFAK